MIYDFFHDITFAYPWVLLLLAILPVMIWWYFSRGQQRKAAMELSTLQGINPRGSLKITFQHIPFILRILALACIILALARPQTRFEEQEREGEGKAAESDLAARLQPHLPMLRPALLRAPTGFFG